MITINRISLFVYLVSIIFTGFVSQSLPVQLLAVQALQIENMLIPIFKTW